MKTEQSLSKLFLITAAAVALAACGDPKQPNPDPDPNPPVPVCQDVSCGVGTCVEHQGQAACECPTGHHAEGLWCAPDAPADLCAPNPCTGPNRTLCRIEGAAQVCDCNPGFVLDGSACVPERVSCEGEHEDGDAFETDECPAQARDIGTGGGQQEAHTIFPAGDADWFVIAAQPGHIYTVSAAGQAGFALSVTLYGPQEQGQSGPPQLASQTASASIALAVKSPAAQLLVRVRASTGGLTGGYTVSIRDDGLDDHGDDAAQATQVTATGVEQTGRWQFAGDQDWLKFDAQAGHVYRFTCSTSGLGNSCLVKLRDATGAEVASDANPFAILTWSAPANATWFVELGHLHGQLADYTWKLADLGGDDHGNDRSSATPITAAELGSDQPGTWIISGDTDWLSFEGVAGHVYRFTCTSGVTAPCVARLVDAAGVEIDRDSAATATLSWKSQTAATWYFELTRPASNPGTGSYTWKLEDLGADDHGDDAAHATPITASGVTTSSRWEFAGDQDWLEFNAVAGHIYRFGCSTSGLGNACVVKLRDAAGTELSGGTSAAALLTWVAPSSGLHHLALALSHSGTADYQWKLEDLGVDDHGNDRASATLIATTDLGTEHPGRWELSGDTDWLKFEGEAGHIYRFTCASGPSVPCVLRRVDALGGEVARQSGSPALLSWRDASAATWYFEIARPASDPGTGGYTWKLEDLGADDHGGDSSTATHVTATGVDTDATWEFAGDKDWMRFEATANQVFRFNCSVSGTGNSCAFKLYDSSGALVTSSSSSFVSLTWKALADGAYYMEFANSSPSRTGPYTWKLTHLSTDEYGDTLATATPVTATGTEVLAKWNISGDLDFLRFDAPDANNYRITCVNKTAGASCKLTLRDSAGTQISTKTTTTTLNNAVAIDWKAVAGNTFYVEIARGTAGTGDYGWKLEDLGP